MPSTRTPAAVLTATDPPPERRFGFRWDPRFALAALPFCITPATAWVRVTEDELVARFGIWSMRTPLDNIVGADLTGPYRVWRTIGPARLDFGDKGTTFATTPAGGVLVRFLHKVPVIDPSGLLKSPNLTLTVADRAGLRAALLGR